jgi:8-oxo-dGTP pyrophosphatase MutT (NUDIX family)
MQDESDTDVEHTALRETEEELGIPASMIDILGMHHDVLSSSSVKGEQISVLIYLI